jgi:hypothetical protein
MGASAVSLTRMMPLCSAIRLVAGLFERVVVKRRVSLPVFAAFHQARTKLFTKKATISIVL